MRYRKPLSAVVTCLLLLTFSAVTPASALFEASLEITDGTGAGAYPAEELYWTIPVWSYPGGAVTGPTVYGGYGCVSGEIPPASALALGPGDRAIVVLQRGPSEDPNATGAACYYGQKVANAIAAGYDGVVIANHHVGAAGASDRFDCQPPGQNRAFNVAGVCVGHRAFHALFGRAPDYTRPYPVGDPGDLEPDLGETGGRVRLSSPGEPLLASGQRIGGGGWASFAVTSPGGKVRFPIRLDGEITPGQLGGWLYDENDRFLGGIAFAAIRSEVSTFDSVDVAGTTLSVQHVEMNERQGFMAMTIEITSARPERFKLLVWGTGRKVASWQWSMRGGPGVVLEGVDQGDRTWYYTNRDFAAPANVEVNAIAGARATVLGTKTIDVADTLIGGLMTYSYPPTYLRSVRTPARAGICQDNVFLPQDGAFSPCTFTQYAGAGHAGPGRYTFEISGPGAAALPGFADVVLWGTDSRMPRFPA